MTEAPINLLNEQSIWSRNGRKSLLRQYLTIINISFNRYLFTRYMWVLLGMAGLPVFISGIYCVRMLAMYGYASDQVPGMLNEVFQTLFRTLYIHFIIFFIANIFGFSLLRKEVDDRTLHYLFLQPVRKTTVILSKYIGFLGITWVVLCVTLLLTYFLFQIPYGVKSLFVDLFQKGRALTLIQECFIMLVALAMYGAFSMVMGSIFKTAWYGLIFYLWETGLPYLPSTMKFFTISHYLQSLTPEKSAIPKKMFELYGEMPSPLRCWITLLVVLAVLIGITVFLIRHYECKYTSA